MTAWARKCLCTASRAASLLVHCWCTCTPIDLCIPIGARTRTRHAAMWNKPHLIALDEPTNYLDNETLSVLTASLKSFRGGVVTVSHNEDFVRELCSELWHVGGAASLGTTVPRSGSVS